MNLPYIMGCGGFRTDKISFYRSYSTVFEQARQRQYGSAFTQNDVTVSSPLEQPLERQAQVDMLENEDMDTVGVAGGETRRRGCLQGPLSLAV